MTFGYGHAMLVREMQVPAVEPAEVAQNWQLLSARHDEHPWPLYTEQSLHDVLRIQGVAETGAGHAVPMAGMQAPVVRLVPQNWHKEGCCVAQLEQGAPNALHVAAAIVALQAIEFFQKTFG